MKETQVWTLGREDPLEKNPLQHSCLENPTDRGSWQATVHRVAKSQTQLKQLSTKHDHGSEWIIEKNCPLLRHYENFMGCCVQKLSGQLVWPKKSFSQKFTVGSCGFDRALPGDKPPVLKPSSSSASVYALRSGDSVGETEGSALTHSSTVNILTPVGCRAWDVYFISLSFHTQLGSQRRKGKESSPRCWSAQKHLLSTAQGLCRRRKRGESQVQGFRAAWGLCKDPTSPGKEQLRPDWRVWGWREAGMESRQKVPRTKGSLYMDAFFKNIYSFDCLGS